MHTSLRKFSQIAYSRSKKHVYSSNSRRLFSVNPEEVSKFSALSSTWWDYKQNPLIAMNPTRIKRISQVMNGHFKGNENKSGIIPDESSNQRNVFDGIRALDVGCGGGLLSESLARVGADVVAIDPSEEIVRVAKDHAAKDFDIAERINFRGGMSVEKLASEIKGNKSSNSDLFDIVCVLEVIEHSSDPKSLLSNAASLLKKPTDDHPGGILFVSTINKTSKSYAFAILGAEYIARLLPIGTHNWENFFSPKDVEQMLPSSMGEIDVCGMVLNPRLSTIMDFKLDENDIDVNWIGAYTWQRIS